VPDQSHGKRRRGSQRPSSGAPARKPVPGQKRPSGPSAPTKPVRGTTTASGIPAVPLLAIGVLAVVVLIGAFVIFGGAGGTAGPSASPGPSAAPGGSVAAGSCPTSQPDPLGAGEVRTVTFATPSGSMVLTISADLSPIAAGNFVALASCGFYDGTPFHRTPTLEDGTPFVIQGGDPTGTGSGGPGYTIKDEPVTTPYVRGTVAMARSQAPDSVGSQFFIVLDDKDGAILSSANTYQIIGEVISGMETADAIYEASGGVELPSEPVRINSATVATP